MLNKNCRKHKDTAPTNSPKTQICRANVPHCNSRDSEVKTPSHDTASEAQHLSHMPSGWIPSLGLPARQVLQRSLSLLANRKSLPASVVSTSLHPSWSKPWARRTRRHANCLQFWEERSPQHQAMTWKELFCSAESFGAGAMLQHGLVTWHLARPWLHRLIICTKFCIIFILKLPWEHMYGELKNNNDNGN